MSASPDAPALRYTPAFRHQNEYLTAMAAFRARGYAVIPNVFERESVDAFLEQLQPLAAKNEQGRLTLPTHLPHAITPMLAPRIRQILPSALSPAEMAYQPAVHEVAWLVKEGSEDPTTGGGGWHKDRAHEGYRTTDYHYPVDVHVGMYFRDMEVADGPTEIIPGSHMDQTLNPWTGTAKAEPFLCRKEDVVIWDQRCWHKAMPRTKPGRRFFALYGFYALPRFKDNVPGPMPAALRDAWKAAEQPLDKLFFGGLWTPEG